VGRVLTFADPDIIKMAQSDFVAVAADDWYQRRRNDEEGKFFRSVADQGPRKGQGGSTRQGIYVFTAGGKLLIYRNHHDPEVMKGVIRQGLKEWQKLPKDQRDPGAVKVEDVMKPDDRYHRVPPAGALIVNVYTRILDKNADKDYCHGSCNFPGGDRAAHDHLWLTKEECQALVPKGANKGDILPLPERVVRRIARFHLVDNTRGEPPHWNAKEIRSAKVSLMVEEVNDRGMTLQLDGSCLLATDADPAKAERGYDVSLRGTLHYDTGRKAIDRFDVVALGEHWGSGSLTRGARPGRTPLGVAFELSRGDQPADQVPPQGSRWLQGYIEAEK
jgi:hypothetical protein